MAYYAALASLVELLKEMIHPIPGYQYRKYLLQKQQITCLYEKFSHLQVLLEDYPPNNKEAAGFLKRIRDVACLVELIIALKISYVVLPEPRMSNRSYERIYNIESQIREPNCLAEIIHLCCFRIFVSAYHNSEPVNEEVVQTMRRGYRYLSKLRKVLGYVVKIGYEILEELKKDVDSYLGEGYLDVVKLKEEIDSIAAKGYQDLVKLNEELDAISSKGHQDLDSLEAVVESIEQKIYDGVERVKKEVDSVVEKGYGDFLEKVLKNEVDPIGEELMMRIKDSHTTRQEDLQVTVGGPSDDGTTMVVLNENLITTIKDQILGDSSKLEVISILGMGGIGKTTLARHIFYDNRIRNHFDFHVWVTVSPSYHFPNILQAIVKSLNKSKEDLNGVEEGLLKELIHKGLFGKRYLIIMDDVWGTNILEDVKWIFPDSKCRSRIIITTRQSNVASLASESEFKNKIPFLEHDQSWNLFCEKVHCPPELEDIGRSIVRHCGGLPLTIVVVAGLLSKTGKTWNHWADIASRVSSAAAENDERFSKILSLSYDHLPHHLKPCFLYLGCFPRDFEITISRLFKLWVAEGFLKPITSKCLEEAAEEYLEELVKRNLVLITERRSNGKSKSCIMHDLLRDLCLKRVHQEQFVLLPPTCISTYHTHTCRLFIHPHCSSNLFKQNHVRHVRSIVSFDPCQYRIPLLSSFRPLRVFDAPYIDISFHRLLNLRFLLIMDLFVLIPPKISQLQHLQTLVVRNFTSSQISLPAAIWKMPRLRHVMGDLLELPPSSESDGGSNNSDRLPSLQTLSTLMDFTFTSRIAEMIPNIKRLKLYYGRYKLVWKTFGLINLVHLRQLETLALEIKSDGFVVRPFPESFAFPSNLRELTLKGCKLPWEDMTVVGELPHLQVLKLRKDSFVGKTWESREGEFSKLKFLEMNSLSSLKNWQTESTNFPCLEHLVISDCDSLEEIPSETGEFPNLQLIQVWSGNSRVKESAREIHEEQLSVGNETLRVRVY